MVIADSTLSDEKIRQEILAGPLDGQALKVLTEAGLTWLKSNQQSVNALNVFPVPDGDTGTNMVLTMQAAWNEIANSKERNAGKMAHAIAQGALMGARGNSGVILSQIWRGFARGMDTLDTVDASVIVHALSESRATAYKGVVKPVEGTILTVIKDTAIAGEKALEKSTSLSALLEELVAAADASVRRTPELLPILRQAGVVDSGGKGLFFIFEGMLRYIKGQSLEAVQDILQPLSALEMEESMETIEPGQDYEVVIDFYPDEELQLEEFYSGLSDIGTSIQIGEGDGMYRMHIHVPTEKRYEAIDYTMKLGTITKVMIENLQAQMKDLSQKADRRPKLTPVEPGQVAVVVVSPGPGLDNIFASLGVSAIIQGGQTMNPSTEEIMQAFEHLPTQNVIILPNNKNIILAAQNVVGLTTKNIAIIPSRTVPQGISALLRYSPDGDFDEMVSEMKEALSEVETGEITTATRSVEINEVKVNKGEVISLLNGKLIHSTTSLEEAIFTLLENASTDEKERITLYYGADLGVKEVNRLADLIRKKYPSHEIEVHEGGQPYYQLIVAIE
ncbi:MAG TPA: DAK2 domain-containing protein [Anaerolineaceae bacterium]|nr:DAK2 domain-containing protein [Anaerolineaceae bacterium]HPN52519.1 DAK2 domain-containing protein [Anaerolineaceae bacterium]